MSLDNINPNIGQSVTVAKQDTQPDKTNVLIIGALLLVSIVMGDYISSSKLEGKVNAYNSTYIKCKNHLKYLPAISKIFSYLLRQQK